MPEPNGGCGTGWEEVWPHLTGAQERGQLHDHPQGLVNLGETTQHLEAVGEGCFLGPEPSDKL